MSQFCDKCGREIVWGFTETSNERLALDAWAERRWFFVYGNQPIIRSINTWAEHQCDPKVIALRRQGSA